MRLVKYILIIIFLPLIALYLIYVELYINKILGKMHGKLLLHAKEDFGVILFDIYYATLNKGDIAILSLTTNNQLLNEIKSLLDKKLVVFHPKKFINQFIEKKCRFIIKIYYSNKFNRIIYSGNKYCEYMYPADYSNLKINKKHFQKYIKNGADEEFKSAFLNNIDLTKRNVNKLNIYKKIQNNKIDFPKIKYENEFNINNFVLLNINTKNYNNEIANTRSIKNPESYNVAIDYLISIGYTVILQGRTEQPYFDKRNGFIDYAHSSKVSIKSDLYLAQNCTFYLGTKSGTLAYPIIFNKPILGTNFTELSAMFDAVNSKTRYYPKRLYLDSGEEFKWWEWLNSPIFFQIGEFSPSREKIEFVDMKEKELLEATIEFCKLIDLGEKSFKEETLKQKKFRENINEMHLDLYLSDSKPCDCYL